MVQIYGIFSAIGIVTEILFWWLRFPKLPKKIAVDSPTRGAATGVGKGIAHIDNTMRLLRFTCNEDLYFDMFTKMIKSFSFAFYFIKKNLPKNREVWSL